MSEKIIEIKECEYDKYFKALMDNKQLPGGSYVVEISNSYINGQVTTLVKLR